MRGTSGFAKDGALAAFLALAALLGACGDDGASSNRDAGTDEDAGADAGASGPIEPALPRIDCPPGWTARADAEVPGLSTCEPWAAGAAHDCPDGEAWIPGDDGCRTIGTSCPAGDWPEDLPEGAPVWYVHAGAAAGGDGSLASPFATIGDAMDVATDGDFVAVSKGTYDEIVSVRVPVTIRGACPAETILASSVASAASATVVFGGTGDATLANVQLAGERPGVLASTTAAEVTVDSVWVHGTAIAGVVVAGGGEALLRRVVIEDVRTGGDFGTGLQVSGGGQATVEGAVIDGCPLAAVLVTGPGSHADLSDVAMRRALRGPSIYDEATATITRAVVEDLTEVAVRVGEGTTLGATDLLVRDIHRGDGGDGIGIEVGGATFDGDRIVVTECEDVDIEVHDAGSLTARDVVVHDTPSYGLQAAFGGVIDVERAAVVRARTVGVLVGEAGSSFTSRDLLVFGTVAPEGDPTAGPGLQAQRGATVSLERARFEGNASAAILAVESAHVALTELVIEATRPSGTQGGSGIVAIEDATVTATRFRIADHPACGVQLGRGGEIDLTDGEIAQNAVGANVQTEGYDVTRLQNGVAYHDNLSNLDSTALPVPEPAGSL